jgi:tRNA(adenine34) deaminase
MIEPVPALMRRAIEVARRGSTSGQYAIGAVLAVGNEVLAEEFTQIKSRVDPSAHAEVLAIRAGAMRVGQVYIPDAVLYTTLEPCPMCASLAIWAKLHGIVFGATQDDARARAAENRGGHSWRQIEIRTRDVIARGTPRLELVEGFLHDECLALLREF